VYYIMKLYSFDRRLGCGPSGRSMIFTDRGHFFINKKINLIKNIKKIIKYKKYKLLFVDILFKFDFYY
jgi:hypothetical protein